MTDVADAEERLFRDLYAETRRLLDRQFRAAEEGDKKSESIIKLGLAGLVLIAGLGTALTAAHRGQSTILWVGALCFTAMAAVALVVGLVTAGHSYVALARGPRALHESPNWMELQRNLKLLSYTVDLHLRKTVLGQLKALRKNTHIMESSAKWRGRAMLSYMVALLMALFAASFLAGLRIQGS